VRAIVTAWRCASRKRGGEGDLEGSGSIRRSGEGGGTCEGLATQSLQDRVAIWEGVEDSVSATQDG
jgi:hypothetical protein